MLRVSLWLLGILTLMPALYAARMLWLVSKSATLVAASRAFERRNGGKPRILVLGDSTGVGTGVTDPRGSIAGRFGADVPEAEIQNLSVNGWRVRNALANFPATTQQHFDLVLLQIGANDILHRTRISDFERDLSLLFDHARQAGKNVVALHSGNVGLAPLFVWPLRPYFRSKTLQYREVYRRIANNKGVLYVDLFREAADDPFKRTGTYYAPDLLHLTEDGYGEWYRTVRETMRKAGMQI